MIAPLFDKTVVSTQDGQEAPASVPITPALQYGLSYVADKWGANKSQIIDGLVEQLTNLQAYLSALINQKSAMKNKISSNVIKISHGKIRIADDTGLEGMDIIAQTINTALADSQQLNVVEISKIQRAMELGDKVRDSEPVMFFDSRRGDQISAKIAQEVVEANALLATINTIKDLLGKEKNKP